MATSSRTLRYSTNEPVCSMPPTRPAAIAAAGGPPKSETRPVSGRASPRTMSMVVDLPAPLGPRSARSWPWGTSRLTSSTAISGPYRLVRCSTMMAFVESSLATLLGGIGRPSGSWDRCSQRATDGAGDHRRGGGTSRPPAVQTLVRAASTRGWRLVHHPGADVAGRRFVLTSCGERRARDHADPGQPSPQPSPARGVAAPDPDLGPAPARCVRPRGLPGPPRPGARRSEPRRVDRGGRLCRRGHRRGRGVRRRARARYRSAAVAPQLAIAIVIFASSVALLSLQPTGPGAEGAFLGVLFFARLLPGRIALPLAAAAFVALEVIVGFSGQGLAGLVILGTLAGCYGLLFLGVRLREANEQAEALLVELEQSRAVEARAAGLAERQRLAREMHDVLAHSLSGLLLQLEGARMLAVEHPADPRLPDVIDRAHHLGKTGLEEARRAIGMLRDDELPGPERLAGACREFEDDRGIPCRLTVSGEPHPLGSEARLALYRVAQEALTNITKHARPDRVELHLAYDPDVTRLRVEDFATRCRDTCRCDTGTVSGEDNGYGLTGMRERAELLGGSLVTEPTCRGFRVELDVPV